MGPVIIAAFPGLLFSVHPPVKQKAQPTPIPVTIPYQAPLPDSCSTYIYLPQSNKMLYFNGKPVTADMLKMLGPLAEPFLQGFGQCNVG